MVTDFYRSEEGYICDGNVIGFCSVQAAVEINEVVHIHGTDVSGYISVSPAAADGDGYAVALKAGAAGDYIPVCFFGVVKMLMGSTICADDMVINDSVGTYILPIPTATHDEIGDYFYGVAGMTTGTNYRLGMALQGHDNSAASGDEILVLVGRIH